MERREFLIGAALAALLAACDRASDSGGSTADAGELRSTIARAPGGGSTELAVQRGQRAGRHPAPGRRPRPSPRRTSCWRRPASPSPWPSPATGAAGVTAAEMDHVLQAVDPASLAPSMNALDQALAARSGTRPDASGTRPIEVALQLVRRAVGPAGPALVAGAAGPAGRRATARACTPPTSRPPRDAARATINGWTRTATDGRVQEILPPGAIDHETTLLLLDAVHLRAPWLTPFDSSGTADAAFTDADGTAVTVPTMRSATQLAYAAGPGWQAVDLPYAGYELTMTVLVPDPGQLGSRRGAGSARTCSRPSWPPRRCARSSWHCPGGASSPRSRRATPSPRAGMPSAFDPGTADFSAMVEPDDVRWTRRSSWPRSNTRPAWPSTRRGADSSAGYVRGLGRRQPALHRRAGGAAGRPAVPLLRARRRHRRRRVPGPRGRPVGRGAAEAQTFCSGVQASRKVFSPRPGNRTRASAFSPWPTMSTMTPSP